MANKIPTMSSMLFVPGLGPGHEHVMGGDGVGVNIITATLACNTAQTIAQLIASVPNTGIGAAFGAIVHSLGRAPGLTLIQAASPNAAATGIGASVQFQYVTANNSAVFVFAKTWTGVVPLGLAVRIVAIPS